MPATSTTVDRSLYAPTEQRLSRDLATLASLANDMIADPNSPIWGWFGDAGWFRDTALLPHNSRLQESVSTLAWFYTHDRPWNPYYNSQPLAERIIAALRYTLSIQMPDGGFQKYTAGFSGPASTGFTLGHLALLYVNLESVPLKIPGWNDYWKNEVLQSMLRSHVSRHILLVM